MVQRRKALQEWAGLSYGFMGRSPDHVASALIGNLQHFITGLSNDRAAIGNRDARLQLTQEILRAFEPVIRQHLAHWFHFVPVWPDEKLK